MFSVSVSLYWVNIASLSVSADDQKMAMTLSLQATRSLEHRKLRCLRRLIFLMAVPRNRLV